MEVAQSGGWPSHCPFFPARPLISSLLPCWGYCTFTTGTGLALNICVPPYTSGLQREDVCRAIRKGYTEKDARRPF